MNAPTFTTASSDDQLRQILELQRRNIEEAQAPEQAARDGFVTVRHDLELLRDMHRAAPQVVALHAGRVVGYALVMPRSFADRVPVLAPMFAVLERLEHDGRPLRDLRWFVMGQVCVDAAHRGQGVFDGLFEHMRALHAADHDLVVTEIATRNGRSLRAHARVGFQLLHRHRDPAGEEWDLVVWDWR